MSFIPKDVGPEVPPPPKEVPQLSPLEHVSFAYNPKDDRERMLELKASAEPAKEKTEKDLPKMAILGNLRSSDTSYSASSALGRSSADAFIDAAIAGTTPPERHTAVQAA